MVDGRLTRGAIPDFSRDPRRRRAALRALDLAHELDMSPNGQRGITAKELRKILGNASSSRFAAFLHTLFDQRGYYSTAGACYEYQPVHHRVERLERILGVQGGFLAYAETAGKSFRVAPPLSEYTRTGDRHYHWWTNMRREARQRLFLQTHGRMFDYDLEAAKPSLTLQAWNRWMQQHHPVQFQSNPDCRLPTWTRLVSNRTAFRAEMALECGISKDDAKKVCQNVLNGAWASADARNGICQLVGRAATHRIMASELYLGLRKDFRVMWSFFKKSKTVQGQTAGQCMSAFYNRLEMQVMAVIADTVKVPAWFIHDGFMTHDQVDVAELVEAVKFSTGYDVKVECGEIFELDGDTHDQGETGARTIEKEEREDKTGDQARTATTSINDVHKCQPEVFPTRWSDASTSAEADQMYTSAGDKAQAP